jgi:integrase
MQAERNAKKIVWTRTNVGYRVLANGSRSYCYRFRDAGGIQRCIFLGRGSTEKEAQAKLAEVTVARSKGDAIRISREPFSRFADRWLAEREHELAPTTVHGYRWHLEKLVKPSRHFRRPISKITQHDVASFIADLRKQESRSGRPLKGWTIRGAVSVLSGVFAEAVDQGLLATNPVQKVARRKREKVSDEGLKRVLSLDEVETLMNAATKRGLKWSALIGLGVYAGLRSGEALGLRWQDVDLEANTIRVRLQRDAKTGELRDLKTESSRRDVPIATPLRRALVEWRLRSDYTELEHSVISAATGNSVSQRNALRAVCDVAVSCGINVDPKCETEDKPNLDFHALRHTFASAMIKATKGDAEKVRRWMGHADIKVLLERYSHEFESARGGRRIEDDIAEMDAAYGM